MEGRLLGRYGVCMYVFWGVWGPFMEGFLLHRKRPSTTVYLEQKKNHQGPENAADQLDGRKSNWLFFFNSGSEPRSHESNRAYDLSPLHVQVAQLQTRCQPTATPTIYLIINPGIATPMHPIVNAHVISSSSLPPQSPWRRTTGTRNTGTRTLLPPPTTPRVFGRSIPRRSTVDTRFMLSLRWNSIPPGTSTFL